MATTTRTVAVYSRVARRGADDWLYPLPAEFDATWLLAPPPCDDSGRLRDIEAVRAAENARTDEQAARAEHNSVVDVLLFGSVLGPRFVPECLPKTTTFLRRVYRSSLPYLNATKEWWRRPRPFVVEPALRPLERSLASVRARGARATSSGALNARAAEGASDASPSSDSIFSPSYPSGHATVGAMMAILLAHMVPEQRSALFARGWDYGDARVISGVHFPSDVEAGRVLGTMLIGMMQQHARFRADLRAARRELRNVLFD